MPFASIVSSCALQHFDHAGGNIEARERFAKSKNSVHDSFCCRALARRMHYPHTHLPHQHHRRTATSPPSASSHPRPHAPVPIFTCTATCRSTPAQAARILYATTTPLISAACRSNFNGELRCFVLIRCSDAQTHSLCMTVRVMQTPCHTRGARRLFYSNHHHQ